MQKESDSHPGQSQLKGPRLWLSLSDADAFAKVQSAFFTACELRRDLSEKAGVLPKMGHGALTVLLLGLADIGKGKIGGVLAQIYDNKKADSETIARVARVFLDTLNKLPSTLWPPDRTANRLDMIEDLRKMVVDAHGKIASDLGLQLTPAQRKGAVRERDWRRQMNGAMTKK